jgi:hypothetical protein
MNSEKIGADTKERCYQPCDVYKKNVILNVIMKILSYAFISSDIFKDNVLYMIPNTIRGGDILLSGMVIQCILLLVVWFCIDKFA